MSFSRYWLHLLADWLQVFTRGPRGTRGRANALKRQLRRATANCLSRTEPQRHTEQQLQQFSRGGAGPRGNGKCFERATANASVWRTTSRRVTVVAVSKKCSSQLHSPRPRVPA